MKYGHDCHDFPSPRSFIEWLVDSWYPRVNMSKLGIFRQLSCSFDKEIWNDVIKDTEVNYNSQIWIIYHTNRVWLIKKGCKIENFTR